MPAGVTVRTAWQTYADELVLLGHGLALWEPAPLHSYDKVNIGDVGYIRDGRFHLLFRAALPLGDRQPDRDVPRNFVPIEPGPTVADQPRLPGALHTEHVEQYGGELGVSSDISCIQAGTNLRFQSSSKQGAILLTKYKTFRTNAERLGFFRDYMLRNYQSWVDFANRLGHMVNLEDVLLVTGHDMTLDFAMLAFSSNSRQIGMEFQAGLPAVASASASVWGMWRTTMSVHHNCGPQHREAPLRAQPLLVEDSSPPNDPPHEYNQCVFLRGYRVRKRAGMFPTVLKAAAGPHDLGSGPRFDENGPPIHTDDNADTVEEVVPISGAAPFVDPLEPLFRYIFEHSSADVALLHDIDLANLLEATSTCTDMGTLITRLSPDMIEIALDGTACIKSLKTSEKSLSPFVSLRSPTVSLPYQANTAERHRPLSCDTLDTGGHQPQDRAHDPLQPHVVQGALYTEDVNGEGSPPAQATDTSKTHSTPSPSHPLLPRNTSDLPPNHLSPLLGHKISDQRVLRTNTLRPTPPAPAHSAGSRRPTHRFYPSANSFTRTQLVSPRESFRTGSVDSLRTGSDNLNCTGSVSSFSFDDDQPPYMHWGPQGLTSTLLKKFGKSVNRRAVSVAIRFQLRTVKKTLSTLLGSERALTEGDIPQMQAQCTGLVDLCITGMEYQSKIIERSFVLVLSGFTLPGRQNWSYYMAEAISRRDLEGVFRFFQSFFALLDDPNGHLSDQETLSSHRATIGHEIAAVISYLARKDLRTLTASAASSLGLSYTEEELRAIHEASGYPSRYMIDGCLINPPTFSTVIIEAGFLQRVRRWVGHGLKHWDQRGIERLEGTLQDIADAQDYHGAPDAFAKVNGVLRELKSRRLLPLDFSDRKALNDEEVADAKISQKDPELGRWSPDWSMNKSGDMAQQTSKN